MRGEPGKTDAMGRTGDQTPIGGPKPNRHGPKTRSSDPKRTAVRATDVPEPTAAARSNAHQINEARTGMRPSAMCAFIISNSCGTGRRPSPRELLLHL